jgi:hypothetical protein
MSGALSDEVGKEAGELSVALGTWIGFAAMGLGMFMAVLDIQVVVPRCRHRSGSIRPG